MIVGTVGNSNIRTGKWQGWINHLLLSDQCLLLILKWGGELTKAGRKQSEYMGDAFRSIYPNKNGS